MIPELKRHLAVCGIFEVPTILRRDRNFWNIISIRDPSSPKPTFNGAMQVHFAIFDDIEDTRAAATLSLRAPLQKDVAKARAVVDRVPGEPVLIHCRAGVSRSTALATVLLVRGHHARGKPIQYQRIVEQLLMIRIQAIPNELVMQLGLTLFLTPDEAQSLVREISNDPGLINNRFLNPQRR